MRRTFLKSSRISAVNFHLKSYESCYTVKCHTFSKLWNRQKKFQFYSQNDTSRCCNKRPNWQFLSSNCDPLSRAQWEHVWTTDKALRWNKSSDLLALLNASFDTIIYTNESLETSAQTHLAPCRRWWAAVSPLPPCRLYFLARLKSRRQNRQQECSRRSSEGWSFSLDTLERYNCGLNYKWIVQAQETLSLSGPQELPSQYLYA